MKINTDRISGKCVRMQIIIMKRFIHGFVNIGTWCYLLVIQGISDLCDRERVLGIGFIDQKPTDQDQTQFARVFHKAQFLYAACRQGMIFTGLITVSQKMSGNSIEQIAARRKLHGTSCSLIDLTEREGAHER